MSTLTSTLRPSAVVNTVKTLVVTALVSFVLTFAYNTLVTSVPVLSTWGTTTFFQTWLVWLLATVVTLETER